MKILIESLVDLISLIFLNRIRKVGLVSLIFWHYFILFLGLKLRLFATQSEYSDRLAAAVCPSFYLFQLLHFLLKKIIFSWVYLSWFVWICGKIATFMEYYYYVLLLIIASLCEAFSIMFCCWRSLYIYRTKKSHKISNMASCRVLSLYSQRI